ncbi:MAG: sigma-54 dependent transcriptional regulator [Planctomycetes bacterium]|nr:sigma-54 dependent transcriptional regulator [Planctomycetota bacterium]
MAGTRLLVIDDEAGLRRFLQKELSARGMVVEAAGSAEEGLQKLGDAAFDVVLLDIKMPGMDGLAALREIRRFDPAPEVLMITGQGSVESAVEAMRAGAFHYLTKPFHLDELEVQVDKARERTALVRRAHAFERLLSGNDTKLVGDAAPMDRLRAIIRKVAPADTSVVIEGESGTGKELIARAIHSGSRRQSGPFVVVNCGALQESLLESELFGHEKGAFTGAVKTKEGLAEAAHGGTLFLDEVGEMSLGIQAKVLRFLESGDVRRVGSNRTQHVDVRVVSATNRRLADEVRAGRFREDLYYRLRVFAIEAPPLRERMTDIPLLVGHFLTSIRGVGQGPFMVDAEAMDAMKSYAWPGNVRELRNAVERMMLLAEGGRITVGDLPPEVSRAGEQSIPPGDEFSLARLERIMILKALRACSGRKREASDRLGISLRTLYNKLNEYRAADGESQLPMAPDSQLPPDAGTQ